jgi:DNA replication protein DnaC
MEIKSRRESPPREVLSEANLEKIGIPKLFYYQELSDFIGIAPKTLLERYVGHIHDMYEDCVNLTLLGPNGAGKSLFASIVLKNAYRHRYTARFITVAELISLTFKKNKDEKEIEELLRINNSDFLCLDEFGKENHFETGSDLKLLIEIMKYREKKGLPIIICTNMPIEAIEKRYGNTVLSLIKQSVQIEFDEDDMRGEIFRKKKAIKILEGN